jgi:hypothetical protein
VFSPVDAAPTVADTPAQRPIAPYRDRMPTLPMPTGSWSDRGAMVAVLCAVHTAGWSRWSPGDADDTVRRTMRTGTPRLETEVVAEIERANVGRVPLIASHGPRPPLLPAQEALIREYDVMVRRHDARLLELARPLGLVHLDSCAERVDFLVATGLLCRITRPAGVYLVPAWPTPLPEEGLALTLNERDDEDTLRWHELFEDATDKIIWLFRPDSDDRLSALTMTLDQIASRWVLDGETVREALLVLLDDGDFTATADLTRIDPHTPFHFTVDWNAFDTTRIQVEPESE